MWISGNRDPLRLRHGGNSCGSERRFPVKGASFCAGGRRCLVCLRAVTIRNYLSTDERDWLRCRALGFLSTAYFDDVLTKKPTYDCPAVELVADSGGAVVGIIDVAIAGDLATIETVAVHPDAARSGIGSLLLDEARRQLPNSVTSLDAWTRDDEAANKWYLSNGFRESFRYLHVYASGDREPGAAIVETRLGLTPVSAFFHADISNETMLRRDFSRVHICRHYVRPIKP